MLSSRLGASRIKMYKRLTVAVVLLVTLGVGVYFVYFHRPPTEDIMAKNAARNRQPLALPGGKAVGDGDYEYDYDDMDEATRSILQWQEFVDENNYVPIGRLFTKCEGDDRIMIGVTALLPDPVLGGITSRTFLNVTYDKDVEGGEMYIDCWYNGKALYSNHWDVCTVEDNMTDDRIINCPVKRGKKKFIKNMKIPNYLPKGHYTTKMWLLDLDDKEIGCAFADFTI